MFSIRRPVVLVVALLVVASACSSGNDGAEAVGRTQETAATTPPTTTIATTTTITTTKITTTTIDNGCNEVTSDTVAAFDGVFDRIDTDPEASLKAFEESDTLGELLGDLGGLLAIECGPEETGDAISEIVVHIASEATTRTEITQAFIEGLLPAFCASDFIELTIPARAVCATV